MMGKDCMDKDFLFALLQAAGASSDEHRPSALFRQYLSACADEVVADMIGNTLVASNAGGDYRILLSAHIDEIGLQVTGYCDDGLLKLRKLGGMAPLHAIGQEVEIHTHQGIRPGIVVSRAAGNNNAVPDMDDCFIDIFSQSKEKTMQWVRLGDVATFSPNARVIGDTLISKAVDDRVGVFVLSQVFRHLAGKLHHVHLSVATTVQEEIGLRGMAVLAQNTMPAVCLNVDVTDACQMDKKHLPKLGDGSALYRNADSNPVLRQALESVAHTADIPLQMAVGRNITGGTDSSRIQLFSPRTAVADISIPCKYMHTHYEQCSLKDIGSCIKLLESFLLHLDADFPVNPPDWTF